MQTEESTALRNLLIALGFPKPPANTNIQQMFSKIEARINELLKSPKVQAYLGVPLLKANGLTSKQWNALKKINQILNDDFKSRVEMLLKRLDVTAQSFKWAERLKSKSEELTRLFVNRRKDLVVSPSVDLSDFLAARDGKKFKTNKRKFICYVRTSWTSCQHYSI